MSFEMLLNEKLCDLADAILEHYNPCRRGDNSCLLVPANADADPRHCCNESRHGSPCPYLVGRECGNRNIGCKTWLCVTAISKNPECVADLKDVESIAKRHGLTKRPFLGQGYVGRTKELTELKAQEKDVD